MRRLLSLAIACVVVIGATVLMAASSDDGAKGKSYKIVFDNGFGLVKGGDFRVGGVRAGQTTDFEATKSVPPKAEVTAKVIEPGFDDLREDATCTIKPQSLIGEYFVDCQPGSSDKKLPDGGTIPVKQTQSTIPQDLVNNVLRRPYRERLRLIINELGTGLAGRPQDLQAVLKRSDPGLRETRKMLRILGNQNKVIENFIVDADTMVAALERRKKDVARFLVTSADAADASASQRQALAETFNKLPRLPRRAAADDGPARGRRRRADPAPQGRPRGGPGPGQAADQPRPVRPGLAAGDRHARRRVGRGRGRDEEGPRRRGHAAGARQGRPRARQAAAPVPRVAGRSPPLDRRGPARGDRRSAGRRPVRGGQEDRLHRSRVALELRLLASMSLNGFDQVSHFLRVGAHDLQVQRVSRTARRSRSRTT